METDYQKIIHLRSYARWNYDKQRRETWEETVSRYITFFDQYLLNVKTVDCSEFLREAQSAILGLNVMPSMRALMTAGPALERDNIAGYNCSYLPIDHVRAFDEIVYILMNGTGVGFSVERQFISKLPDIPDTLYETDTIIQVRDSKLGWAKAYKELIALLFSGQIPKWDVSALRPAGAVLKTFGGRASGPGPLVDLFKFTIRIFQQAIGRKLESLEVHDIVCKIGEVVVSGGVRRSALISLSNLSDQRMRDAKSGDWHNLEPQRRLANNSAAYTEMPEVGHFMQEWLSLYQSKSGERGIFNRTAVIEQCNKFNRSVIKNGKPINFGTNPCGEIVLRPQEFCNLTEIVARIDDTVDTLMNKVRIATMLGTLQSCLTNFRYIRQEWRNNCEQERLLGVSITGIMDCPLLNQRSDDTAYLLDEMRQYAVNTNLEWAKKLNIEPSAAITCVKPSGTVSLLVNSSSGIHPRYSPYYIRRIRVDEKDPLSQFMIDQGFEHERDLMSPHQFVFSFASKSPENAIVDASIDPIEHLKIWKMYREHWCHHNPSVTINLKESEWPTVGGWVWDNFNSIGGISFLPKAHNYKQAVLEEIDERGYNELKEKTPDEIDWLKLSDYEKEDFTTSSQEFACVGNTCEIG